MLRRSVLGTVCTANGALDATTARTIARQQQHRSFTCTPRRSANIPHFTTTSSPKLDSLLDDIRTKIILPTFLPIDQRKRIYSPMWEKRLQADPITMEIDGEVLKFRHVNLLTDIPNTGKSLQDAVKMFDTPADFANLKPLLEGIAHTGNLIKPGILVNIARLVGTKGHIYKIIDCARSVRRTNYKLDTHEKVSEVLHFVQLKAREADWDKAETRQAMRWAEMVLEMLHEEAHQPRYLKHPPVPGELPLTRDPMILAAPLHLAAMVALLNKASEGVQDKVGEASEEVQNTVEEASEEALDKVDEAAEAAEEVLDKVHKLARDLVTVWPDNKRLRDVQPAELSEESSRMAYLRRPGKFVILGTPLLHGLDTAIKVVADPELAGQLQIRRDTLAAEIQEARREAAEAKAARIENAKTEDERNVAAKAETRSNNVYSLFYDA
ncbi:hypothetical protein F4859DRAFT_512622 [Xylaria cf. heliscus]|nr:hypothetical protein F4859DRAFT_512622 [Xylaria cf. heliscus]